MHYFGYYLQNGSVCSVKWEGEWPIGGKPAIIVQKHLLTKAQFEESLSSLAVDYPYKELR